MIRISRRDRLVLAAGVAFVLLFLVLQFAVFPLLDGRQRLRKGITARQEGLAEMSTLQARYRELHGKANSLQDQLEAREGDFSLFSFLEQKAAEAAVKEHIAYMKPSATADDGPFKQVLVEMKLQAITLQQLVDFLKLVEAPDKIVALKRVSIQENKKDAGTLNVIMQVVSLDRNPDRDAEQG